MISTSSSDRTLSSPVPLWSFASVGVPLAGTKYDVLVLSTPFNYDRVTVGTPRS